ncbi:hypothetical protein LNV23_21385 [Paucibacter sp. DJ1R-11]|uniref:hypothetical protein n=1 Tax=Paucibacter sp. DJ1R-11 TaxID=2893556 RepID=UPI0021E49A87|nr:hypothetical protein [Paucibacter sp. DJ1R-11]MCV2366001.1 hypothetical protein [Paucibacter sp. DJ1R-11]
MSPRPPSSRSRAVALHRHAAAWRVWALLALMLAFQGLGQSHRILHGAGFARALVPLSSLAPVLASAEAKVGTLVSADGWGHQRGELVCLLLDQLSHDHAPLTQPVSLLPDLPQAVPSAGLVALLYLAARWKRAARGPPQRV